MKRLFSILPVPFWCYTIPMVAATLGILPHQHPLYDFFSRQLLPVALVLLLIGADLKRLLRLGSLGTFLTLAGSLGTMLGAVVSFLIFKSWLPEGSWAAVGALCASWIGGSANLLAVKESLGVSDSLIGPIIIVDTAVAYSWMALLLWSSGRQENWIRIIEATHRVRGIRRTLAGPGVSGCALRRPSLPLGLRPRDPCPLGPPKSAHPHTTPGGLILGILISILLSLFAQRAAQWFPTIGEVVTPATWTILIVTTVSIGLSLSPLSRLGGAMLPRVGTFLLYALLASIGARADLRAILDAPAFLALGVIWILLHGMTILLAGWLLKAPLGLIATASQANIGGPISAPIVGATFSPAYATMGLLMAILGNVLGTYLGLLTALGIRF